MQPRAGLSWLRSIADTIGRLHTTRQITRRRRLQTGLTYVGVKENDRGPFGGIFVPRNVRVPHEKLVTALGKLRSWPLDFKPTKFHLQACLAVEVFRDPQRPAPCRSNKDTAMRYVIGNGLEKSEDDVAAGCVDASRAAPQVLFSVLHLGG